MVKISIKDGKYVVDATIHTEISTSNIAEEVSGYSATGLSKFLTAWLDKSLDLEKNLDKSEHSLDDVRTSIEMALVEIGMEAGNGETKE